MKEFLLKLKNIIITKSIIIWNAIKNIVKVFKREGHETKVASEILLKIIKGKEVSPEEVRYLKNQSVDLSKALAIIGLQAIPGSSIAIIAIEKVGEKYGFTLFPRDQMNDPWQEKDDHSDEGVNSSQQNDTNKIIPK